MIAFDSRGRICRTADGPSVSHVLLNKPTRLAIAVRKRRALDMKQMREPARPMLISDLIKETLSNCNAKMGRLKLKSTLLAERRCQTPNAKRHSLVSMFRRIDE